MGKVPAGLKKFQFKKKAGAKKAKKGLPAFLAKKNRKGKK